MERAIVVSDRTVNLHEYSHVDLSVIAPDPDSMKSCQGGPPHATLHVMWTGILRRVARLLRPRLPVDMDARSMFAWPSHRPCEQRDFAGYAREHGRSAGQEMANRIPSLLTHVIPKGS